MRTLARWAVLAGLAFAGAAHAAADPYGFAAMWEEGDAVSRAVVVLLVAMSVGSWYVTVAKLVQQAAIDRQARSAPARLREARSLGDAAVAFDAASPFRYLAEAGVAASAAPRGLFERLAPDDAVTLAVQRAIDRVQARLQGGVAFLATVASTAPFVGLFGTVWGIYHALTAIGVAGQASIDKVAGPVGEALIMTAMGLAVAVPAVLGYNALVRRNKLLMDELRAFAGEVRAVAVASAARD